MHKNKKKEQKDKHQFTKHNLENYRISNSNPNEIWGYLMRFGRVCESRSTCVTRRIAHVRTHLVGNLIWSHSWKGGRDCSFDEANILSGKNIN